MEWSWFWIFLIFIWSLCTIAFLWDPINFIEFRKVTPFGIMGPFEAAAFVSFYFLTARMVYEFALWLGRLIETIAH